jgi:hypothetical protein
MRFILLILLFLILYPIIKIWLALRRSRRHFDEVMRQARDASETYTSAGERKRYTREMGEYADFEEVSEPAPPSPSSSEADAPQGRYEDQIVDAEYEDIKN